jgi:hypothetical protein
MIGVNTTFLIFSIYDKLLNILKMNYELSSPASNEMFDDEAN